MPRNSKKKETPYKLYNRCKTTRDDEKDDQYWVSIFETYLKQLGSIGYCSRLCKSTWGKSKKM